MVRDFVRNDVAPTAAGRDAAAVCPGIFAKMAEPGLTGIPRLKKYGGPAVIFWHTVSCESEGTQEIQRLADSRLLGKRFSALG